MDNLNPNYTNSSDKKYDILNIIENVYNDAPEIKEIEYLMSLDKGIKRKELEDKTKCLRVMSRIAGIRIAKSEDYFTFCWHTYSNLLRGLQTNPDAEVIWQCAFVLPANHETAIYLLWLWGCLKPRKSEYEKLLHKLLKDWHNGEIKEDNGEIKKDNIIAYVNIQLEAHNFPTLKERKERKDKK